MTLDMDAMTGTDLLILAGAAFAAGLVGAIIRPRRWWLIALVIGALFPAYTLSAALLGIRRDPTSNNLFPIAVGFACLLTGLPAFVGAGAGELIGRNLRTRSNP
jgi:hypothetical protein